MRRYAGRYNLLHGGGPRRVREPEQVIAAGAMPAIVQALTERRRERAEGEQARRDYLCDEADRKRREGLAPPLVTDQWCCLCNCRPCENPSACRAQARYEDDPGDTGDYVDSEADLD
jgi:hypothetical protein